MPKKYDVIIIGAGVGGLTAGAILARNGKKVLMIEKNSGPGGYATNFRREKFEFDSSLHLMNSCNIDGRTYSIFKQCGITGDIKFLKPKFLYRTVFPDMDIKVEQCKLNSYINNLIKLFPKEKTGIKQLFSETNEIYNSIYRFDRFGDISPEFIKSTMFTSNTLLDKYINSMKLKSILFQLWAYFGLPPSKLPIFYFTYPMYNYTFEGGYYPKGGSKNINLALSKVINMGVNQVLFNKTVTKILVKDGVAKGVVTTKGDEFYANSIISNIDARRTFYSLINPKLLPFSFVSSLNKMKPSISAIQVYLGLDVDLNKIGILDYELFLNPNYDIEKQYKGALDNEIDKTAIAITAYSNLDKHFAPKNKSVVVITMYSGYEYWRTINPNLYKDEKDKFTKKLIKKAEILIPGLSKYIQINDTATPLTMERYTGSYKGAIYGWEQSVDHTGIRRLDRITAIKNLYLAGAWTRPGGGLSGVIYSGKAVAEEVLHQVKKKRW